MTTVTSKYSSLTETPPTPPTISPNLNHNNDIYNKNYTFNNNNNNREVEEEKESKYIYSTTTNLDNPYEENDGLLTNISSITNTNSTSNNNRTVTLGQSLLEKKNRKKLELKKLQIQVEYHNDEIEYDNNISSTATPLTSTPISTLSICKYIKIRDKTVLMI
jgi:hypothetical protein